MKIIKTSFLLVLIVMSLFFFSCEQKATESDNTPPTVVITYPANNSEFVQGTEITVTADATDNKEVDKVEFYIDGIKKSNDYSEPYQYDWDTSQITGSHTVYAKAYDTSENVTTSGVITVKINEPIQNILSGYVKNALNEPIEDALITVTEQKMITVNRKLNDDFISEFEKEQYQGQTIRLKKNQEMVQSNILSFPYIVDEDEKENTDEDMKTYNNRISESSVGKSRDTQVYTDENGYYEITDLEEGDYTITVEADYYEEEMSNVTQTEGVVTKDFNLDASLLPQVSGLSLQDGSFSLTTSWYNLNRPTRKGYNSYSQEFHWWSDDWTEDTYYFFPIYSSWERKNNSLITNTSYSYSAEEYNSNYGAYVLPVNIEDEETSHSGSTQERYRHMDMLVTSITSVSLTEGSGPFYIPDNTHEIALHIRFYDSGYDPIRATFTSWSVRISTNGTNWQTIGTNNDLGNTQVDYGKTITVSLNQYKGESIYIKTNPTEFPGNPTTLFLENAILEYSTDGSGFNENDPPNTPSNPSPSDNSLSISIDTDLSWECSDPDSDPLTYDVYFGTSSNPPLVNSNQSETTYDPGTLDYNNDYYWKIVAHDDHSNQTVSDVWEFTTFIGGTGTVTDIDGNVYQTIIIGNQYWMAENLKVTHYRNGDPIPNVTDNSHWTNLSTGAYCYYDNDPANEDTYGALYNWYAVNEDDSRGLAPAGWHVPTDDDWKELEMFLGMTQAQADDTGYRGTNEGSKLAGNASLWSNGDLINNAEFGTSGFTALPGGVRYYDNGFFGGMSSCGWFWSSSEYGSYSAWYRLLGYSSSEVGRSGYFEKGGVSIRCVRD